MRGVLTALVLRGDGVDAGVLGFEGGHRTAGAVAEDVIGSTSVGKRVLEEDARAVGDVPARVLEKGIDLDPGEGFFGVGHGACHGLTSSSSISTKSMTFLVTTVMPRERAIAAIWQSAGVMRSPAERRMAARVP